MFNFNLSINEPDSNQCIINYNLVRIVMRVDGENQLRKKNYNSLQEDMIPSLKFLLHIRWARLHWNEVHASFTECNRWSLIWKHFVLVSR